MEGYAQTAKTVPPSSEDSKHGASAAPAFDFLSPNALAKAGNFIQFYSQQLDRLDKQKFQNDQEIKGNVAIGYALLHIFSDSLPPLLIYLPILFDHRFQTIYTYTIYIYICMYIYMYIFHVILIGIRFDEEIGLSTS